MQVVDVTFAIMIGLVYCIIQPVITIVILLFFMTSFVVVKYNFIYRLRPAYESGGLVRTPVLCTIASHRKSVHGLLAVSWPLA